MPRVPETVPEGPSRTVQEPPQRFPRGKPTEAEVTQQIDDFDILAKIGEGAFALVYLARQRSMQRIVALKVSTDQSTEPQTLAQLDHPHIVRVYDQRLLPSRGLRLLYMPYLAGGTLRDVIALVKSTPTEARDGRLLLRAVDTTLVRRGEAPPTDSITRAHIAGLTWSEAVCWLGSRLAEALEYAHQHGVLHRDIKPANVLLGADASPRLADFNISSCSELEGSDACATFGGSLAYMSPEQLEAFNPEHHRTPEGLDHRTDIYSLAVTLWELLTGTRPFASSEPDDALPTLTSMMARRESGILPAIEQTLPPGLPEGLRDILKKCLAADREERYATAGELARQLDLCLKPQARELLLPKPGWRTAVRRHPSLALYGIGLAVNLLAAWVSIVYNKSALVDRFPAIADTFNLLLIIINGTFFPLCMLLFWFVIRPVVRGLRHLPNSAEELAKLRHQCLQLGPGSVRVCLWAWVVAGLLFPLAMHWSVQELPIDFHLHFLASQTICGLIAVSYPQFGVSLLALRGFYPAFVTNSKLSGDDVLRVKWLDKLQGFYLVLAGSVPMIAMGLLASIGAGNKAVLVSLSIGGVFSFAIAYWFSRAIHADCTALESVAGK